MFHIPKTSMNKLPCNNATKIDFSSKVVGFIDPCDNLSCRNGLLTCLDKHLAKPCNIKFSIGQTSSYNTLDCVCPRFSGYSDW